MNRTIKFRVWDRDEKKMKYPKDSNGEDGLFITLDGEAYSIDFHCPDGGTGTANVVLMQYTGLKDKNRTEIYEGDRVNGDCQYGNRRNEPVFWSNRDNGWFVGHINMNSESITALSYLDNLEVIGNIFDKNKKNNFIIKRDLNLHPIILHNGLVSDPKRVYCSICKDYMVIPHAHLSGIC